jgi:hypothetical protein
MANSHLSATIAERICQIARCAETAVTEAEAAAWFARCVAAHIWPSINIDPSRTYLTSADGETHDTAVLAELQEWLDRPGARHALNNLFVRSEAKSSRA